MSDDETAYEGFARVVFPAIFGDEHCICGGRLDQPCACDEDNACACSGSDYHLPDCGGTCG